MKDTLTPGLTKTVRFTVDRARTIEFLGEDSRVYATPELVRDIETTCRELIGEHLDAGEDTVGVRVELDHLAATLLGMWVEITATLTALEGRRVTLDLTARDAVEDVARGKHIRFIVDVKKSAERFKQKAEKAKAL
ncbi:MAG: thioesterase family protein [Chloroflexota bacterium]